MYLWNAASGSIDQLMELDGNDYVSSLSWIQAGEGEHLAVGTSTGTIQVKIVFCFTSCDEFHSMSSVIK